VRGARKKWEELEGGGTLILPSWDPVANISESLLNAIHSTAASIIMKLSYRW